ncbi:hypothetical protein FF38_10649 [Lucilia cuprina]|uniref:Uncharacterized protein n=1 Tax=Lucilia cuprina TaxID=7375 RepID=A0A0L0CPS9_LUCCU|nr:hypothetical protein FF38_10649 [Lucilia cuprina]
MGNTGSAHNLHSECVDSELNSYYTQQYLRRTGETKNKYNQVILGGWSSGRNLNDCKVLPKPTDNLKLRATTNGAILQAGGTISFRSKEQLEERTVISGLDRDKDQPAAFKPMRRCHTLILDSQNESISHRKSAPPTAEFRRSQTLLHVGYNRTKSQENISTNLDDCNNLYPQPATSTPTASTSKVNKYNKKRKAPAAPTNPTSGLTPANPGQNVAADSKNTSLAKPRKYATNSNKPTPQQQQPQNHKPQQNTTPLQRGSNTRTSINSLVPNHQSNIGFTSKLPYRREKSFDAVLLRQKESNEDYTDRTRTSFQRPNILKKRGLSTQPVSNKLEENAHRNVVDTVIEKKKPTRQQTNVTSNKMHITTTNTHCLDKNYPREIRKIEERTLQGECNNLNVNSDIRLKMKHESETDSPSSLNKRKTKTQQSRIPQLKRTFYFGMETTNKSLNSDISITQKVPCRNEEKPVEEDNIVLLNHNIEDEEEIVDNGILVHVRPTLPRRQPETPSFSPAAAWRNLLEEQQRLQHERSKPKNVINNHVIESPICLPTKLKDTAPPLATDHWTPQQDLDDDDEEEPYDLDDKCKTTKLSDNINIESHKHPNSMHIFSLSLPRDVHLQCQKSSMNYMEQENSLKAANCWLVPGFNSLQKFKSHLGKNIVDSRTNSKCTCAAKAANKRNSYHLQTIFGDTFSVDSKSHQPDCDLFKTTTKSTSYHNDNWVLHKSKTNDTALSAIPKTSDDNCFNSSMTTHSLVQLQPKSLTNVCGGKHIVYLPGQNTINGLIKSPKSNTKQTKTSKTTYKRQRQRQEMVRESLQDLTPIQNMPQSNVGVPEKNTHRFSFQSTVRVLEKRRLAEKLSKDAEIQEAQRLNELEAMKRVEEDFQRKRAPEKANLRNQLRLHLKANTENEEYRSLPLNINDRYNNHNTQTLNQHISDVNNNLYCRAEPDGAVSPSLDFKDNLDKVRHSNFPLSSKKNSKDLGRFDSDGEESETQMPDLRCTALLIEPYLHSII